MVRKKLDNRIRTLVENGVALKHRSLFVIVGDKAKDQVVILHHILSKSTVKARPSVLWCYKKELGFSSHRKKRMRLLKKKAQSGKDVNEEDPFELFVSSTQIRYCYYSETHKILGNTFGMCVLQDFEALTPNLLARTIETVEGGGIVAIFLQSMTSLKQLFTMTMDVHARYRTEAHNDVVARFNERFLLSLASCSSCIVVDDQLTILPISAHVANIEPVAPAVKTELTASEMELKQLKESLIDTQPIGVVINLCKTIDQAKCVLKFFDVITEKTLRSTVSLTAARGRGKSAALGLSIAGAVAFGYSNIFVTSPSPENLKTLFEFIFKGLDALEYQEHIDYELVQSTNPEFNKAIIRVNIFREHRQTIQFIHPSDASKLGQAELVVIDEAAAIPLPLVKALLGPYLVFLASTINGYEGTGRSLSLKLIQQIREQTAPISSNKNTATPVDKDTRLPETAARTLTELTLEESIRYAPGDNVEMWLNRLLCLDAASVKRVSSGCPAPQDCDLYNVNRDTLFCFHKASEAFLQRLMSIYVSAHYKNTPNDLQMMSDAPAHQLYCLLGPVDPNQFSLPEIICVVQVCFEGQLSRDSVGDNLSQGKRPSGDMIPWTVAQQFQDNDFPLLAGARIVRIATHPDYQGMGYGSRAIQLLTEYFEGRIPCLNEVETTLASVPTDSDVQDADLFTERITPRKNLPPLLLKLSETKAIRLHWLGVSFGLTNNLIKFWKKAGFLPVYLRQTTNDLTGEHSCIMLKMLNPAEQACDWLVPFFKDFRRRFLSLLSFQFSSFPPGLALNIAQQKSVDEGSKTESLTREKLACYLTNYDLKRLDMYGQNLVDHHLITDLLPQVALMYFSKMLKVHLSIVQAAILVGVGLQHKSVETVSKDLDLPVSQLLGLFNRTIRKIVQELNSVCASAIEQTMKQDERVIAQPTKVSLKRDLDDLEKETHKTVLKHKRHLLQEDNEAASVDDHLSLDHLEQFAIKGDEQSWKNALQNNGDNGVTAGLLSVKRVDGAGTKKKLKTLDFSKDPKEKDKRKAKKFKAKKK